MFPRALFLPVFLFCYLYSAGQIYVSPSGDDTNPGTINKPLATLSKAVRIIENNDTVSRTVILKPGTYYLDSALVLTNKDSGRENNPLLFKSSKGSHPVLSGGVKITDISLLKNGLWEIKLPDNLKNKELGDLYVNGKRAVPAVTPDNGFFRIKSVEETIIEKGKGRVAKSAKQEIFLDDDAFKVLVKVPSEKLKNVRFKIFHNWDFSIRFIDSLNTKNKSIITHGQGMKPWNPWKKGSRILFENFPGALTKGGEWVRVDSVNILYFPYEEENINTLEVVVPVAHSLLKIIGSQDIDKPAENIRFEGITFEYCGYPVGKDGFEPNQAAVSEGAAIYLENAHDVDFVDCEIIHTGQHAIWFGKGCSECLVEHCYLNDLGGGGIYLGGVNDNDPIAHTSHITIKNNIIHTGGRNYPPAVGIWTGHSSNNIIEHNDIGDFYYTGISVGWVWGYKESKGKRNVIKYNNIHHIGWDLLSDMAGVYTLGKSEGTVISNNVIHHIHAYSYGGWGLYTDEGSSGILMENNLVYSTKTGSFHQHYGENNIIRNNIFAFGKLYQIQCTRVEDHLSFLFKNNIIIFDRGVVLEGPWSRVKIEMDSNIYWNIADKKDYSFAGKPFKKWVKRSGHDKHSYVIDPGFVSPQTFDFKVADFSNINKIGFKYFDYSKAGVTGDTSWILKSKLPDEILKEFDEVVKRNMKDSFR